MLHGRETEKATIANLVASARLGVGASLAVLGEAGAGKSSLLRDVARQAALGMTVVTTSGIESEAPLAFAALQRLLRPLTARLDAVPSPQARALRVAFGEEAGEVGDRFLVYMGVLSLLAVAAEERPVLAMVDDAQWLDQASAAALHFSARRITVEPIALLWAARDDDPRAFDITDLPVLRLAGLDLDAVSAILAEETGTEISAEVAALLLANTGGNPLGIRELPSVLTPEQLTGEAPVRAREIAAEAVSIAAWGGDSGSDVDATTLVPSPAADAPARERAYDQMLRGLARVVAGDYAGAAAPLREAFATHEELPDDYDLLPNLSIGAMHLGEFDRSEMYINRLLTAARNSGVLVMVLYASTRLAMTDFVAGRWSDAVSDATEAVTLGEVTGHNVLADTPRALLLLFAALRGEEMFDELAPHMEAATSRGTAGLLDVVLRDFVHWAHGIRQATRPASAFHRLAQMSHDVPKRMAGVDRIEAAVRADQIEAATLWVDDFAGFAAATGQAWAAAVAEHGRALLADPDSAGEHFRRALEFHGKEGQVSRPFNRARTELAYGEFLRRTRRRVDARTHLRAALDTFEGLRAAPWAERAAQELRASGETVRKRDDAGAAALTPQERQVAQLVRRGLSNKDVAAQLFVSPRTVEFHLRNVFTKAGVTSRGELTGLTLD